MKQEKRVPRMYHRRLTLLMAGLGVVLVVLTGQTVRLTVVKGAENRSRAERVLDRREYLAMSRGRILDRNGLVLALDVATYSVAVPYEVLRPGWVLRQARVEAMKEVGRSRWLEMEEPDRQRAAETHLATWQAKLDRLWWAIREYGQIDQPELDRRIDAIRRRVETMALDVWERREDRTTIAEQKQAHVILPIVSDEVAYDFRELAEEMPGMLEVRDTIQREHRWSTVEVDLDCTHLPRPLRSDLPQRIEVRGVADHLLGAVRNQVYPEDLQRRPFTRDDGTIDAGGYQAFDVVGSSGLEMVFEDHLRGERGYSIEHQDTGEIETRPSSAGNDLHLTLDARLQARIQAILSHEFGLTRVQPWQKNTGLPNGTRLNSAAVVLDIPTGEILSLVSMPTLEMGWEMTDAEQLAQQPAINRPVQAIYPPGSIIKPLVLASAITDGLHALSEPIECKGHYFPNVLQSYRCWIFREQYNMAVHGPLLAREALAESCNIYFYTIADRMKMGRLIEWFRTFGLGRPLDIGLEYTVDGRETNLEHGGYLLPDEDIFSMGAAERRREGIALGIGQGRITWTPIQAANAYAMIARGGSLHDATLVKNDPRGTRPPRAMGYDFSPRLLDVIYDGLEETVLSGSASELWYADGEHEPIINAPGVRVMAKTGTAEAPPWRRHDTDGDGDIDGDDDGIEDLDHAWFVGLVGPASTGQPRYVIAVIVEYGGSGGRTAGPVANQIIHALQLEGYLPAEPEAQ